MRHSEYYTDDVLRFFRDRPLELALYEDLFRRLEEAFPDALVKVQKSQISFYGAHLFAMASLPKRKKDPGIVVTFGLGRREPSPRIGAAVEPYPNRWTHHVTVTRDEEIDGEAWQDILERMEF